MFENNYFLQSALMLAFPPISHLFGKATFTSPEPLPAVLAPLKIPGSKGMSAHIGCALHQISSPQLSFLMLVFQASPKSEIAQATL